MNDSDGAKVAGRKRKTDIRRFMCKLHINQRISDARFYQSSRPERIRDDGVKPDLSLYRKHEVIKILLCMVNNSLAIYL